MEVKIKRLDKELPLPQYAYDGDAGFDVYAAEDVKLNSLARAAVATGIALEIPEGFVGLVWDRSGLSIKHGIKTLAGVIDSGYRGEVKIGLVNVSPDSYEIKRGDRIAQILIQRCEQATLYAADELTDTQRGDKKFGSSGM
jgi:dUTP pyrophosphatase